MANRWDTHTGVRVYKDFRDNVVVLPEDAERLESLPIGEKAKETFPRTRTPKICSENSEDAVTWSAFRTLELRSRPEKWIPWFWEIAFREEMPSAVRGALNDVRIGFWVEFPPPPSRPVKEGKTQVDVTIRIGQAALIFVEAKLFSPFSAGTKYDPGRDQVIRNIDVGSHARRSGEWAADRFNLALLTATRSKDSPCAETIGKYRDHPDVIRAALPYRDDIRDEFDLLAANIGWICWADVLKIALRSL